MTLQFPDLFNRILRRAGRFVHFPEICLLILAGSGLILLQSAFDFPGDADAGLLLRIRGHRDLPESFRLVVIDEPDIQAMGGWPVTRDYYAYLVHVLSESRASAIGLDILLDSPNRMYPEYDRLLADFMAGSGKAVLPFVLGRTAAGEPSASLFPFREFRNAAAAVGFSDLGGEAVIRRIPIVAGGPDHPVPSFGLAMALTAAGGTFRMERGRVILSAPGKKDIRVPVDRKGRMRLNPAGGLSSVRTIRITDLLRMFETSPDSLDFGGTLVDAAPTAPSLPVLKATALDDPVPASVIQATAAENILAGNWLRDPGLLLSLFWILIWAVPGYSIARCRRVRTGLLWLAAAVSGACLLAAAVLAVFKVVLPVYASAAFLAVSAVLFRRGWAGRQSGISDALREQLRLKEEALAEAERKLDEVHSALAAEKAERTALSEAGRRLREEKEAAVLELEKQVRDLRASVDPEPRRSGFPEIVHGPGSPMIRILGAVEKVAADDIPVLIHGETGTGKELVARAVHRAGPRRDRPFVAVNCGALSEPLLESELFGHERGAFTGAHSRRRGRFELAEGGTLFLDEVTETSSGFQARLLRVLQDGTFERVGGEKTLSAHVRVVAAHNRNLETEVREGRFREDLYFRLKGFVLDLPSLRERPGDIPVLARFFVSKYGRDASIGISDAAMERMAGYRWPGNVRELENTMRRAVLLARSEGRRLIQAADLPDEVRPEAVGAEPPLYHPLETQVLEMLRAFRFSRSAISETARALGNRDRGTVTEHFRGLCFQFLVQSGGDFKAAASALAGTAGSEAAVRVESKMREYLGNAVRSASSEGSVPDDAPCFKGLPQKYRPFLRKLLEGIIPGQ
ncbi:MAG: sigma 54-interacting transcriptional regulator [bacterium]|nr:sigma 54-interacting transcriptional regulator [bacterium]